MGSQPCGLASTPNTICPILLGGVHAAVERVGHLPKLGFVAEGAELPSAALELFFRFATGSPRRHDMVPISTSQRVPATLLTDTIRVTPER